MVKSADGWIITLSSSITTALHLYKLIRYLAKYDNIFVLKKCPQT